MTFATIPLGPEPPLSLAVCSIKLRLDQSQQGHGHPLHLIGPQDRFFGPGTALFHAQALFVIAEAVFLPETGAEHFEDFCGSRAARNAANRSRACRESGRPPRPSCARAPWRPGSDCVRPVRETCRCPKRSGWCDAVWCHRGRSRDRLPTWPDFVVQSTPPVAVRQPAGPTPRTRQNVRRPANAIPARARPASA